MNKVTRIAQIIIASFALGAPLCADEELTPNILWIIAEDMSPDLGCYGHPLVKTPNIDALASKGMLFENVFTTAPACSPSRTALATGVYQTTLGAHHMRYSAQSKPALPDGIMHLPALMRERGYFTANVNNICGTGIGKDDWQFKTEGKTWDSKSWKDLMKSENQPFFAQINSQQSHRRFASNPKVSPDDVTLPPYYPDHPVSRLDWAGYLNEVQTFDKQVGNILQKLKDEGIAHSTIVCVLSDHGRPMIRGKNWLYDSGTHIPLIIYYPEELRTPHHYKAGTRSAQLISAVDLVAETIHMSGGSTPQWIQGRPFLRKGSQPRKYIHTAVDRIGNIDSRSRAVRDTRYKYIRNYKRPGSINEMTTAYRRATHPIYHLLNIMHEKDMLTSIQAQLLKPLAEEELYDLEKDPFEINNLIGHDDYADTLKQLKVAMDEWLASSQDKGLGKDSDEIAEHFKQYGLSRAAKSKASIEKTRNQVQGHFKKP